MARVKIRAKEKRLKSYVPINNNRWKRETIMAACLGMT